MKEMLYTLSKKEDEINYDSAPSTDKDVMLWNKKLNDLKAKTPKKSEQLSGL